MNIKTIYKLQEISDYSIDKMLMISYKLHINANGVKNVFNCPFSDYIKTINLLYINADYSLYRVRIKKIYKNLHNRAIKGRLLPSPERVLQIIFRIHIGQKRK